MRIASSSEHWWASTIRWAPKLKIENDSPVLPNGLISMTGPLSPYSPSQDTRKAALRWPQDAQEAQDSPGLHEKTAQALKSPCASCASCGQLRPGSPHDHTRA